MGLKLKLVSASYTFDTETTVCPFDRQYIYDAKGRREREERSVRISTVVQGVNEAAITTAIAALMVVLDAADTDTLRLYEVDGTTPTENEIEDIRIRRVSFPNSTGPEYAVRRVVNIDVTGYVEISGKADDIIRFQESLHYTGGGDRYVHIGKTEGRPEKYRVAEYTTYFATQSGTAVGRTSYPLRPEPIFPGHLVKSDMDLDIAPFRTDDGRLNYQTMWVWNFASAYPMEDYPNTWL